MGRKPADTPELFLLDSLFGSVKEVRTTPAKFCFERCPPYQRRQAEHDGRRELAPLRLVSRRRAGTGTVGTRNSKRCRKDCFMHDGLRRTFLHLSSDNHQRRVCTAAPVHPSPSQIVPLLGLPPTTAAHVHLGVLHVNGHAQISVLFRIRDLCNELRREQLADACRPVARRLVEVQLRSLQHQLERLPPLREHGLRLARHIRMMRAASEHLGREVAHPVDEPGLVHHLRRPLACLSISCARFDDHRRRREQCR